MVYNYLYIYLSFHNLLVGSVLTQAFGYQITHIIKVDNNNDNHSNNNSNRQPSRHFDFTIQVKELDRFGTLYDENIYDIDLPNSTIVMKKKVVWHHRCYWEGKRDS